MLRLAVFDMDGTLKRARDPYVYLHRRLGTLEAAEVWTEQGRRGEISYVQWLGLDVSLWKGRPRSLLRQLLRENPYLPGAKETVRALRERGVRVVIISSGLLLQAEMVAADLGIDLVRANEIGFAGDEQDPVVSGEVRAWVPFAAKGEVLAGLQAELGVVPEECLAVGDGRTDLPLFERAAVSVAVAPTDPEVAAAADIVLPEQDLRPLLPLLQQRAPHLWNGTPGPGPGREGPSSCA